MLTIILQTSHHIRRYEIGDSCLKKVAGAIETFKKDFYSGPVNVKLITVPDRHVVADLAIPYEEELSLIKAVEPVVFADDGKLVEAIDQPPAKI